MFELFDGAAMPAECVEHPECCSMRDICPTRDTWVQMKHAVLRILEGTTLQDLVERRKTKVDTCGATYCI